MMDNFTPAQCRAAIDVVLASRGEPRTTSFDWLGVMAVRDVARAVGQVINTRQSDAAFIAEQARIAAVLREGGAETTILGHLRLLATVGGAS